MGQRCHLVAIWRHCIRAHAPNTLFLKLNKLLSSTMETSRNSLFEAFFKDRYPKN